MQEKSHKIAQLSIELGKILKKLRNENTSLTLEKLAYEYDIPKGTLSKIENGKQKCLFVNLWKIAEAHGVKCSSVVKLLEDELGSDFKLMDE